MEKAWLLIKIIIKIIWVTFAVFLFIGGLIMFIDGVKEGDGWMTWFAWGTGCAVLTIFNTIKTIVTSIKEGAEDGANDYTYNNGYISNHPFLGALMGLAVGILASMLVGPIYLLYKAVDMIGSLITNISDLRRLNSYDGEE